jgi:predicted nuclease with RNAse H fold
MKIIGIDLAGFEKNDTGFCVFENKNVRVKIVKTDQEIISEVDKEMPDLVCIDGPITLPIQMQRKADLELKQYGALPPLLGGMRYLTMRGNRLREELVGYRVIEVLNRATVKILGFAYNDPAERQKALLAMDIKGDIETRALTKDEVDSITAAITGYLYLEGKAQEIGDEEGIVVVPKV